ncbi:hypothetical protein L0664_12025 [Octadecabacter sp. G9-8]|uniref:Secreted protein n=1 Tax=Octadecabacter dasysiphoniae TaxID=2909341 RepID=A0ABS9CX14_9RHOB|nr:hypothetical protein [Octadecabacter dasysiphoniae]MCF2871797.1 hypothetical protein [Octadecabacter dasysiphoniae]
MKIASLLIVLAVPAMAQDYAIRDSDSVPTLASLSDTILDRDLEYFDGGISRYNTGGDYAWTYAQNNGGGVHTGTHDIQDNGIVCVTYDAGPQRCDMFVMAGDRLVLLTDDGQRYPLRDIR